MGSVVFFHLLLSPGLTEFLGKYLYPPSHLAGHLALAGLKLSILLVLGLHARATEYNQNGLFYTKSLARMNLLDLQGGAEKRKWGSGGERHHGMTLQ